MIDSKDKLKYYLLMDAKRYNGQLPKFRDFILGNEKWFIFHYIKELRYVEYYLNTKGKRNLNFLWHWFIYKRLGWKLNFIIFPNTVGPGFRIFHSGNFTNIGPDVKIGKNCTLLTGCVFGHKHEKDVPTPVIIGDNFYAGLNVVFVGSIKIGNNVEVGANAVVTKDFPDNVAIAGVPAKIIKRKKDD